jgi:hypothetical protein
VTGRAQLGLVPVSFAQACQVVEDWHRRHCPPRGHKFSIGLAETGRLCGVVIVGRPVARRLQDGWTLEVTRTCTDGTANANSMLLGAARRAGLALGYRRLVTYTQAGESGASLRAAGWRPVAECPARPGWDRPSRPRAALGTEGVARTRWEAS